MFNSDGVLTDKRMREKAKDDIDYPKHPKFLPKYDQEGDVDYVQPQERLTPDELLMEWKRLFRQVEDINNPWLGLNWKDGNKRVDKMTFVKGKGALFAYRLQRILQVLTKPQMRPVYNVSRLVPRSNADDREEECQNMIVGSL